MKISAVDPASPLFGKVRPGYSLLNINGLSVRDIIDYHYRIADDHVRLEFENTQGERLQFQFRDYNASDLGLSFEDDPVMICKNKCPFCFVHQQPRGMRRALYIKDDDYRLSFTHGNFITLSNLSDDDIRRIIEQRLSPLYVSVHVTDDTLRRCIFQNEKLPSILPQLKFLIANGIKFHTQVVLSPGFNDGPYLERTIDDLSLLYPGVMTLAVVPVGLTKYREKLPSLRTYRRDEAIEIVNYVHKRQKEFRKKLQTRFVFVADEFYIISETPFPSLGEYEEMAQFENGVGMIRHTLTDFNRRRRRLEKLPRDRKIIMLTGESAFEILDREIVSNLKKIGFKIDLQPVKNDFWGESVTVSGLLTGGDLYNFLVKTAGNYDIALLPPNCLNKEDLFLDNLSLEEFRSKLEMKVLVGKYSIVDTIGEALL
ncbi:MAG: DUF512 domain-containing protein [Candidatus Zixiibacteriota bacterium]